MDEELGSVPVLQYVGCWDHAYYGYYCPLTVNLKHEWFKRKAIQEGNTVPTQGGASNLTTSDPRPSGGVGYNGVNNSTGSFQSPATPRRYSEEEGTVVLKLGRAKKADIRLDVPNELITSRNHASLYIRKLSGEENGFMCTLEDLGSLNCMYVNYTRLDKQSKRLCNGDIIHFGGGNISPNENGFAETSIQTPFVYVFRRIKNDAAELEALPTAPERIKTKDELTEYLRTALPSDFPQERPKRRNSEAGKASSSKKSKRSKTSHNKLAEKSKHSSNKAKESNAVEPELIKTHSEQTSSAQTDVVAATSAPSTNASEKTTESRQVSKTSTSGQLEANLINKASDTKQGRPTLRRNKADIPLINRLTGMLNCAICEERLAQPCVLPCSHVFCAKCIVQQLLLPRQEDMHNVIESHSAELRKEMIKYKVFQHASHGNQYRPEELLEKWLEAKGSSKSEIKQHLAPQNEDIGTSGYSCPVCEFSLVPPGCIVVPDEACSKFPISKESSSAPQRPFPALLSKLHGIPVSAIIRRCSNIELMLSEWLEGQHHTEQDIYHERIKATNDLLGRVGVSIHIEQVYTNWSSSLLGTLPQQTHTPSTAESLTSSNAAVTLQPSETKNSSATTSFRSMLDSYSGSLAGRDNSKRSAVNNAGKQASGRGARRKKMYHVGKDGHDSDATQDEEDSDGVSNWSEDD